MRIISRDAAAAAAAPRSTLHFILVLRAQKKKTGKCEMAANKMAARHSRHSALPCAKKQAAKDEDEVRGGGGG